MAKKTVVVKVTSKGLKQTTADAKELEKVLKKIGKQKTNAGGGGKGSKGTADQTKKQTEETKKSTQANDANAKSGNRVYNSNRGISGSSGKAGKDMGNMAAGMGGFIHVYATLAAHAFALSAAFEILKTAMDTSTMIKGLEEMGATSGNDLKLMAKDFRDVTGAAVSTAEAMRTVAFASSAGMSGDKIKELGKVARGAALALGRDVGDAVDRLTRGVVKLEPEILDELGLIVRVDQASQKYAKTIGKKVAELTAYEKQQAFANETIEQGIRKYGELNDKLETNPFNRLASEVADLSFQILELINKGLGPIANFFANNKSALIGGFVLMTAYLAKTAMPMLKTFGETMETRILTSEAAHKAAIDKTIAALALKEKSLLAVKKAEAAARGKRVVKTSEKLNIDFGANTKSMKDLANGDAKTYITQMSKRLRMGEKDATKAFASFTKQFPNVTKKQFLGLRTQLKGFEKANLKVAQHVDGIWRKTYSSIKIGLIEAKGSMMSFITATKTFALKSAKAIGGAFSKAFGWVTGALLVFSLFGEQLETLGVWLGLLDKGSTAVDKAFENLESSLENTTKAQEKYAKFMEAGIVTSSDYIHKHEVLGNVLKSFKGQAEEAAKALGKLEQGKLSAMGIDDLSGNVGTIKSLLETYKKFGNAELNTNIDKALKKNNLNLDNLVESLSKNPTGLKSLLEDLSPVIDHQSRASKSMQGELESLAATFESFSDNFKKFGDEFKVKTPFDKMVQDITKAINKISELEAAGESTQAQLASTFDTMSPQAARAAGIDDANYKEDRAKAKASITSIGTITKEAVAVAVNSSTKAIEALRVELAELDQATPNLANIQGGDWLAEYLTNEQNKREAIETKISEVKAKEVKKVQELELKAVKDIARVKSKSDNSIAADKVSLAKKHYRTLADLQERSRNNTITIEVVKARQADLKLIKDSTLALEGQFEAQKIINKATLDNLVVQRKQMRTALDGLSNKKSPAYLEQEKNLANIDRRIKRIALTTSDIRVDVQSWNEQAAVLLNHVEATTREMSTQFGVRKELAGLKEKDSFIGKLNYQTELGRIDLLKLELTQVSELNKRNKELGFRKQQQAMFAQELLNTQEEITTKGSTTELEESLKSQKELVVAANKQVKDLEAGNKVLEARQASEKEILSLKQKQAMIDASGAKDVFSRVAAFKKEISGDALSDDLLSIGAGSIYADQEASTKNIKDYQVIVLDRLKEQSNEYEKHLGFIKAQIAVVNDPRETVVDRKDATFADQGTALYDEMQKGTGKFADTSTSTSTSTSTTSETALAEVSGDTAAAAALAAENRRDAETELNKWLIDENQSTLDVMALHWEKYSEKAGLSQIKGFGRMATAFNGYSKLSGKQQERKNRLMDTLDKKQFKSETDRAAAKVKLSGKLANIETQEKLSANAGMFGAMGDMMAKDSKAQQAFHAIEKAIHIAKMAMMAAEMVGNIQSSVAAATSATTVVAAETTKMGVKGTNAILTQGEGDPYTAFARMAAMGALVAVILGSVSGAGGASSTATPKTQRVQGSASLETPEEKSDSLKTALENIEEIEIKAFEQGWDVLYALRSIDNSMTKLSTDIIKGMQALGGIGTFSIGDMETVFGDWFGTTVKPAFLGLFGGKSTTTELMGAGIQIVAQKLADVIDLDAGKWANLELKVWEKIKTTTTKSGFLGFGGGTSSSSQTKWKDFDTEAEQSFAKTLFDIGDAVLSLGEDLGYARSDLIDNLKDFEIAVQDIDLMGLSPEEQASAVQSALSSIANDITLKMLPAVEQWRHAGEEYLEALSRVYRDMLGFKQAFATIGLSTKDFLSATGVTDILNWQQKVLSSSKGGFVDIKGLLSTMEKFSKALYSEGELAKIALDNAKDRVGTGLAEFGLAAGTSADEFRAWYESKLGTGFFDDPDKLATMLRLGEAFGDMTNSADDLSSAFGDIIGLIDDMKYGELSSLTDADKYSYYKTEAERLSTAAMGGDIAAGEQLADMMSKFTEMSKDMFGGVGTFMTDRDWALKQLEDFRALMGFATGGIAAGGFKAFANGGLVNRPTLGLVGEGAFNEAIVPLPDGKSIPVSMNSNPMVMEIRAFREEQAQLMQSAVTISTQERDEMKDAMEGMKQEIIELRSSTEGFGSSVERVATSIDYGRA